MSVLSYPERGQGGSSRWPGNCSPHVYQHLFELLSPRSFVDPMAGSFTSIHVAERLNIPALGLDLHQGFNILRDPVRDRLPAAWNGGADLVLSHPPYHTMIRYSGNVWGDEAHPDDLSQCASVDEFLEKLTLAVLNQRDATREGGVYGVILGDLRERGQYHALTSDLQASLPRAERRAILIKAQHNMQSNAQSYGRLRYGRIAHEYILLYERLKAGLGWVLSETVRQQQATSRATWAAIVRHAVTTLGPTFTNGEVYAAVLAAAPERVQASEHWKAKVRQTLQRLGNVKPVRDGHWQLAA